MSPTFVEGRHPGVLRGNGFESKCWIEVVTRMHFGLGTGSPGYDIAWSEKALPDGNYKLYAFGRIFDVTHHGELWEFPTS